jgi:hypothetical protein
MGFRRTRWAAEAFLRFAMSEHTPTLETLDEVAPRLRRFSVGLIERLRGAGMTVRTVPLYLLSSSSHIVEVPIQINSVSVQMDFSASFPAWSDKPLARLQVSLDYGKRRFFYERSKAGGLPMARVLDFFLRSVIEQNLESEKRQEVVRKQRSAEQRFHELQDELGFPPHPDPHFMQKDNIGVKCLPEAPGRVALTLVVSHEQAIRIVEFIAEGAKIDPPRSNKS